MGHKFDGMSPSGKAHGFGPCIRGFESLHPSQVKKLLYRAFLFASKSLWYYRIMKLTKNHRRFPLNRYGVGVLLLMIIVVATGCILILNHKKTADAAKSNSAPAKEVVSMFSFGGASGWTKGPTNGTSMALFHTGIDGCFVSAEYKTGTIDPAAAVQQWSSQAASDGHAATEVAAKDMTIKTNTGVKNYTLHEFNLAGDEDHNAASPLMTGVDLGYLPLSKGYIKFTGDCNTADELPPTLDVFMSYKFDQSKYLAKRAQQDQTNWRTERTYFSR